MKNQNIRIMVVDDNDMMRRGLAETISVEPGMETVGTAANAEEALELYRQLKPDIVTMDYQMPGDNGIRCTRNLVELDPEVKIILLSVYDSEEDVWRAVQAGVKGYLSKKTGEVDVMIEAIQKVAAGKEFFPENIQQKLEKRSEQKELTPREKEVLILLSTGNSNKDICDKMDLSLPTVKFHIRHLCDKLNATDRTDAVVKAFRKGILHIDQ